MDLQRWEHNVSTAFIKKNQFPMLKPPVRVNLRNTGTPPFIKLLQHVQNPFSFMTQLMHKI